ncbi:MAG: glycine betaine/L-proline ABC transporter ATP-binding protein [Chloroflexi bacterium]|nr:glycine betaine/L-proline ABC transporter ATP-binding protein [Chloroflexota bacterium]
MHQPTNLIEVDGLWKCFGNMSERVFTPEYRSKSRADIQAELGIVLALRNVSFGVRAGEIFVVMGLSGSGKSTLVRCLIRLIDSDRGRILFDGEDIGSLEGGELLQFRREKMAMVFQHYSLLPHRRVMDNVAYGLEVQGMDRDSRYELAARAIETVGLDGWEEYYPREMSGGMQQRVGLARALAVDPQILLMDEPFSGLDPLIRREMQDELLDLQKNMRKTIVFITHDLNEALKLGDRIAIMRDGEIIQLGTPEQIVTRPSGGYVREFVRDVSRAKVIPARAIMRDPRASLKEDLAPSAALRMMDDRGFDAAYLVGTDARLRGLVSRSSLAEWAQGDRDSLDGIPTSEVARVSASAPVESIITLAARSERPVAVVDDDQCLVGEIHRLVLLAALATAPP